MWTLNSFLSFLSFNRRMDILLSSLNYSSFLMASSIFVGSGHQWQCRRIQLRQLDRFCYLVDSLPKLFFSLKKGGLKKELDSLAYLTTSRRLKVDL